MSKDNNNVSQLQNMMFEAMRRLSDPKEDLDKEIKRSQALSSAGTVIINSVKVQIDAARVAQQAKKSGVKTPKLIGNEK